MKIEEINKKAYEKYLAKLAVVDLKGQEPRQIDLNEEARNAYIEAYKEISALPTIEGWVARYKNNRTLGLYSTCPKRNDMFGSWVGDLSNFIDPDFFHSVTWESEPKKVSVIIKAE